MSKKIVDFILFSAVFINGVVLFRAPFEGYLYYIIALIFIPIFAWKMGVPQLPIKILIVPGLVGFYHIVLGNNDAFVFLKIWGGLLFLLTFYYGMINYFENDINKLFSIYLKWSVVISFVGIFQVFSFVIGFKLGYDYSWLFNKWGVHEGSLFFIRLNSLFSEPSQYAITMAPAVFISLRKLIDRNFYAIKISKITAIFIVVAYLLTTSSVSYFGILVMLFIYLIEKRRLIYLILIFIIIPILANIAYSNIKEVRVRADSFYGLVAENDFSIKNVNNSSFVLYNNFIVSWRNLLEHPLGTGLGSHAYAFEKYSLTKSSGILKLEFNSTDGNSTFIRLMSETGVLGIGFVFWFLFKYFSRKTDDPTSYIISTSLLVLIILHLFRQGNYFLNGFPFFVLLYYFNGVQSRETVMKNDMEAVNEKLNQIT